VDSALHVASLAPVEPAWRRWLYAMIAVAVTVGYCVMALQFWVPAHGGTDQNGYLLGAKQLLRTGSMAQSPPDEFGFVGRMWVTADPATNVYYPKYPIGLPAIYAVALAVGGIDLVYLVNPVAMSFALLATYLLVSRLLGGFYGILGMLIVTVSPVTVGLTNNPNSHATAACTVAWGMLLLFAWWRQSKAGPGAWARAICAGLLLGMAVTIRYTEGLLLLPVGCVIAFAVWDAHGHRFERRGRAVDVEPAPASRTGPASTRWSWRSEPTFQAVALLVAWALPVGALLTVNHAYFGSPTGYDPTHESTGFRWTHLADNWDVMLRQFHTTGLAFIFPVAMIGLAVWFRSQVRTAIVLAAWALPCIFIYTVYYWAPDGLAIGYSRFFLTVFPALVAAGLFVLQLMDVHDVRPRRVLIVASVACFIGAVTGTVLGSKIEDGWGAVPGLGLGAGGGALVGVLLYLRPGVTVAMAGSVVPFMTSIANLEADRRTQAALHAGTEVVTRNVPADAIVFSKDALIHHLQFVGDWQFYPIDLFSDVAVRRLAEQSGDLDKAQPFQAERAKALHDLLKDDDNAQLARRQNQLMEKWLTAGRRVFFVVTRTEYNGLRNRFFPAKTYKATVLDTWSDAPAPDASNPRRLPGRPARLADRAAVWQVIEVTRRDPIATTAPATTQAAPTPSTQPAR
jgi:hypothetical protein